MAPFVVLFEIEAWDVNCPQHIHRRFSQSQIAPVIEQLQSRIAELEVSYKGRSANNASVVFIVIPAFLADESQRFVAEVEEIEL